MWFTRLAIARPILIWMALAAIAVLGIQAYFRLPAELNPRADIPTLTVTTVYPGAGPPEIETQISKVLEDTVGAVPGVKDVYSSSQANVSILSMDFVVGTDLDVAVANVRGRLESARALLPPGAGTPLIAKLDINAQPVLYLGLSAPSQKFTAAYAALADNLLRPRLQRVPGLASVQVLGGEQREIHVDVDALKLAVKPSYNRRCCQRPQSLRARRSRRGGGGGHDARPTCACPPPSRVPRRHSQHADTWRRRGGEGDRGGTFRRRESLQGAAGITHTLLFALSSPYHRRHVATVTEGLAERTRPLTD